MKRKQIKSRAKLKRVIFKITAILIVILIIVLLFDARVKPVIRTYAETASKNEASLIINDTVSKLLQDENITYSSLVSVEKDNSGNIKAITTDVISLNLLKSEVNFRISEALDKNGDFDVEIPLGMIFNSDLLSGLGPDINTRVKMTGNSKCDIGNEFLSAGINQTLHRIMLSIEVELLVVLPDNHNKINYKTNMCIAETVIVGITPSSFGRIYS
ncbi:MAG: sporulation protein YunB [Clostridia bacterium]|nr:sporulation protein YunB [Clostridia bacterium]